MRDRASSGTAAYVAFLRALGDRRLTSVPGFGAPITRALLPEPWRAAVSLAPLLERLPRRPRERVVRHVDLFVRRSLAIDDELTGAVDRGCTQLVILGSGFDDRGHRMPVLASARVFEVDHPATQAVKRSRAASLTRSCRHLTYVPCDFTRDALAERLAQAGHRIDEPTAWIWEGVTLYLADAEVHETLAVVGERSAPGSTLVVEYHDADAEAAPTLYARARRVLLRLWSEPQIGRRSQETMRRELESAKLHCERDFAIAEQTRSARLAVAIAR
jgi:methyltransferase (TIGR00027 family)